MPKPILRDPQFGYLKQVGADRVLESVKVWFWALMPAIRPYSFTNSSSSCRLIGRLFLLGKRMGELEARALRWDFIKRTSSRSTTRSMPNAEARRPCLYAGQKSPVVGQASEIALRRQMSIAYWEETRTLRIASVPAQGRTGDQAIELAGD